MTIIKNETELKMFVFFILNHIDSFEPNTLELIQIPSLVADSIVHENPISRN